MVCGSQGRLHRGVGDLAGWCMVGKTYRPKRVSALESLKEPSKQYTCLGPSPPIASESRGRTQRW